MISEILVELAKNSSRLAKESILKREKDNEVLKRVLRLTLDPYINYYIKKIPEYTEDETEIDSILLSLDQLQDLETRKVTGNDAIEHLRGVLSRSEDPEVIERIIGRDLKCGVDVATVNKIWPGLIPTFEVMLAHKDCSGIKYPCIGQTKMDGMRVHVYWDGTAATVYTRNGKQVQTYGRFDQACAIMLEAGEVLDGELLCMDNGKYLDRKTSNGICNKGVKNTISPEEASMLHLVTWDLVDFSGQLPYITRLTALQIRHKTYVRKSKGYGTIHMVETRDIKNEQEAQAFYDEMVAKGEEGVILKNTGAVWEGKRTKNMGKMKAELDCTLRVVDWVGGTGKYTGMLGALLCETEDGVVQVSVGTGWSDDDRKTLTKTNTVGKLLDVRYNARIKSKGDKAESLFLPRAIEFRTDKTVADTSGDLK